MTNRAAAGDALAPTVAKLFPTAYDVAMLLAAEIPRIVEHEGHFASIGTTVRCAGGTVELVLDVAFFAPDAEPVRFVLPVTSDLGAAAAT